jgi:hypothetical protein
MPATPARIARIIQPYTKAIAGPDAAIAAAFGELARETPADEPVETFFSNVNDAQALADERLALMKANRSRFDAELGGEEGLAFARTLVYSQTTPCATVIDAERDTNRTAAVAQIRINLNSGSAGLLLWG